MDANAATRAADGSDRGDGTHGTGYLDTAITVERQIGREKLTIQTGLLARQADGAVLVSYRDSVVLVAGSSAQPQREQGFFPLTLDYRQRPPAPRQVPGRLHQARDASEPEGDPDRALHGPADPAALRRGVQGRGRDHGHSDLRRPRVRPRRPRDDRRLRLPAHLEDPVPRSGRLGARRDGRRPADPVPDRRGAQERP